jgi:putative transposase
VFSPFDIRFNRLAKHLPCRSDIVRPLPEPAAPQRLLQERFVLFLHISCSDTLDRPHNLTRSVLRVSIQDTLEGREERFVCDRLHKMSRHIVEWSQQFETPCVVFEDLKEMRDSIDYGTQMNRHLYHLPFHTRQYYTSYKRRLRVFRLRGLTLSTRVSGARCADIRNERTVTRSGFMCRSFSYQDHSGHGASVNIAVKGIEKHQDWNVPALNSLPHVRKVRRQASEAMDAPTVRGYQDDSCVGVSD